MMAMRETWKQRRLRKRLEELSDLCLTHGLRVYYKSSAYGGEELWINWPDTEDERTLQHRYEAAKRTLDAVSAKSAEEVWKALKFARKIANRQQYTGNLYKRLAAATLEEARKEALVRMIQSGQENHPAVAMLAEAETPEKVWEIFSRRELTCVA